MAQKGQLQTNKGHGDTTMPAEAEPYNQVQLIGNLGDDPKVKYFESSRVAECRIAVYNGKDKRTGENNPSMWITVKAWNAAADELLPPVGRATGQGA
jgi:single-stranded DNA-binding protein